MTGSSDGPVTHNQSQPLHGHGETSAAGESRGEPEGRRGRWGAEPDPVTLTQPATVASLGLIGSAVDDAWLQKAFSDCQCPAVIVSDCYKAVNRPWTDVAVQTTQVIPLGQHLLLRTAGQSLESRVILTHESAADAT